MTSLRKTFATAFCLCCAAAGLWAATANPEIRALQRPMTFIVPDASYSVEGAPDWLAIGEDSVWVSSKPTNAVVRLDLYSNRVLAKVMVKKPCSGLAIGAGSLWSPSCEGGTVDRIDIASAKVIAQIPVGPANTEGGIAFGGNAVWMPSDPKGVVSRIDPATNKVVAKIPVAPGSFTAIFAYGLVWVTSTEKNLVSVIHPVTNQVIAEIPVDAGPRFLTAGEGYVWTLNQTRGTVSKIDPRSRKVVATIDAGLPGPGGDISAGEGGVWLSMPGVPVTAIDPATNRVTAQFAGKGGDALRVGAGFVWLSNGKLSSVWRMTPEKVTRVTPHEWLLDAKKYDLDGSGVAAVALEDAVVFIPGEPLTLHMQATGSAASGEYVLKTLANGKSAEMAFVHSGHEWTATIQNTEPGWIHYSVCESATSKCSPALVVASPNTSVAYATHMLRLVPDGFLSPPPPAVAELTWHALEPQILPQDYLAVANMNTRKGPLGMVPDEDYGELKRHLWEFEQDSAYGWGLLTADEKEELACVYIQPSVKKDHDAIVIFWVTKHGAELGLEPILDHAVREWVKSSWPFHNAAYPGRDISMEQWKALPDAGE